jgi:catechol 2,3-dioxygenase-like lactoylglutathione lyase family enzyme
VFDHVTLAVSDRGASEAFYDTVLAAIGVTKDASGDMYAEWGDFSLRADDGRGVTRRLHIGFQAPSREHVDAFWRAGVDAGYRDDGEPGPRPQYTPDYYGGFLLDPDGNSAEAVHHEEMRGGAVIDHLWIRVGDVATSRAFYETIAGQSAFRLVAELPERVRFEGSASTFSLVAGEPSANVHLAFPASDDATVEEFHRIATEAGYRDNGKPGERAVYHPGYYGAFLLDPDGNNVEVVNHNRG